MSTKTSLNELGDPDIFKLNFYSFESVLDCLSLQDVVAVGLTCERLLSFARDYFKLTFQSAEVLCGIQGLFVKNVMVDDFIEQIKNINIWFKGMDAFQNKNLISVEKITLHHVRLVPFDLPATFLQNIKKIELRNCSTSNDFYDSFLSSFGNLEQLHIKSETNVNSIIGANNNWMHQKYPKLKCFGLEMGSHASHTESLVNFLSKNPQVTNLIISSPMFLANRETFLQSTIKLTTLTIKFLPFATVQNVRVNEILGATLKLRNQKFYEKLTLVLEYCFIDHDIIDKLVVLNLTELRIDQSRWITNKEILAKRLVSLQTLAFDFAYVEDIVPFVQLSKKLADITAKALGRGEYLQNDILDLMGLSNKRREIGLKLKLFVGEEIYVCTKNATRYNESLLIELKRFESKLQ